jgi:hypothetical protein
VDLVIAAEYGSLVPLLQHQPYLGTVFADPAWQVQQSAPMTPREPPQIHSEYDHVYHLGYDGWPMAPLPDDTARRAGVEIDLQRPWMTSPSHYDHGGVVVGFTDEWFELKVGLWELLMRQGPGWYSVSGRRGSRWQQEAGHPPIDWLEAAAWIAGAQVFLGCCSALHVLACALGIPCVIAEPAEARHHPIFWPYGTEGPRVLVPKGIDGRQTWDARHVADAVRETLARVEQG